MGVYDDAEKREKNISLWQLLGIMARIGCIGFGGGNALIPIMQKELVETSKAVTAEEFNEDVVVSSITPGALPVEIAGGIGSRLHGTLGMFFGALGMALPGVCLELFLLSARSVLDKGMALQISFLMLGVSAYIICMLLDYIVTTVRQLPGTAALAQAWLVIGIVFLLTCGKSLYNFFSVDTPPMFAIATVHVFAVAFFLIFFLLGRMTSWRLVVAAILSLLFILVVGRGALIAFPACFQIAGMLMLVLSIQGLVHSISRGISWGRVNFSAAIRELLALAAVLLACAIPAVLVSKVIPLYIFTGLLSSVMSFGGGDAYLTVADGLFVETVMITEDEFYGGVVPIVNLLPGSVLCKTLSGIGYFIGYDASGTVIGALLVATAGFAASIVASCGVFSVVRCFYQEFQQLEIFRIVRLVIRPIVSGLLLTVALNLVYQGRKFGIAEEIGWTPVFLVLGLATVNSWLYFARNISNLKILCFSVGVAMAFCNFWI